MVHACQSGSATRLKGKLLVPKSVWHLEVAELPGPARLHQVLKAAGVQKLQDLNGRGLAELLRQRNCGARTIATLEDLLQRAVSGEFDSSAVEGANAYKALLNLIEAAIKRLPDDDRCLLLERHGAGWTLPLTLKQLGTQRGLTRQRICSILQTLFAEIRRTFGPRIPRLLDRVRQYCISNVCPLTPRLLEELASDFQSQFRFSLVAHVRLIGALDERIPCWPNGHDTSHNPNGDSRRLAGHIARIAWQAQGHLTLAEVYRRLKTQRRHRSLTVPQYLRRLRNARRIKIQFVIRSSP